MANAAHNEARAEARYVRVSPQKVRLVIDSIRGQQAGSAIDILKSTNKRIAPTIEKVLRSAIANAENNHQLDVDRLVVSRAEVGRSMVMRRFHARGRGRSARVEKWFSHLKIVVTERAEDAGQEAA